MDRYTKGFVVASLVYFFLAAVLGIWMGGTNAAGWVRFAHVHFNLLGFMSMMIYGVGYFILPRFNGRTLRWPSWVPAHFYAANLGLIGMVATAPERPSTGFILFSALSVLSTGMFAVNLGATMLTEPKKEEEEEEELADAKPSPAATAGPAPTAPPPAAPTIDPDMRVGEILTRWPQSVDVFVGRGFASLANPEHREQVKQIPITLRMACQRHNVDLDSMVSALNEAISPSSAPEAVPPVAAKVRKGKLSRGETIGADHILGEILSTYPETEKVFRKYYGDGCFSCPGQATESVKQSAMMHNVNERQLLAELNQAAG
jgi:hybrid cluster-associated redox disulfide protein